MLHHTLVVVGAVRILATTVHDMIYILHDLKDPKTMGNYGMSLILGNAGFLSSTLVS